MSAVVLGALACACLGVAAGASALVASDASSRARLVLTAQRLWGDVRTRAFVRTATSARNDARRRWDALRQRRSRTALRGTCLDELPELLDVLALGLAAGISFDAALGVYCERYETMLSARLADAMRSWQLGLTSRRDALRGLADELSVDAFSTFASTVTDSLALGAPLAQTLVNQAEAVRDARRADRQEAIEKAPVKMLVPIGTLILPAMLLSILGPLFSSFTAGP